MQCVYHFFAGSINLHDMIHCCMDHKQSLFLINAIYIVCLHNVFVSHCSVLQSCMVTIYCVGCGVSGYSQRAVVTCVQHQKDLTIYFILITGM